MEALVFDGVGSYRLRLRECTQADANLLMSSWVPILERGPLRWLDRGWFWADLTEPSNLAFDRDPEWKVLSDELDPRRQGDVLGVVVTTGPHTAKMSGLDEREIGTEDLVWVEYLAIAPSIRTDCAPADQRSLVLKGVGAHLMIAAIERSRALNCRGRLALHAEGSVAIEAYTRWKMKRLPNATHRAGGEYPVFFGDTKWASSFVESGGRR